MGNKFELLKRSKHKIKDVCSYFIGNLRFKWKWIMRKHIREQINLRHESIRMACKQQGTCVECGCSIPELLYANKRCDGKCYPKLFGKSVWKSVGEFSKKGVIFISEGESFLITGGRFYRKSTDHEMG